MPTRGSRPAILLFVVLLAAMAILILARMATRPLWYDEISTLYIARIPEWSARFDQLLQAVDGQPPLYYWLCRGGMAILPDPHLWLRLPSLLGGLLGIVALFAFTWKRAPGVPALLAATIPLVTAFYAHTFEARPYALLFGLTCTAVLGWQSHREGKRWGTCLFAASLVGVSFLHYYAFLSLAPFAAVELYRFFRTRRMDFTVVGILFLALLPYAYHWPLMKAMKSEYSAHYWAPATMTSWFHGYEGLFLSNAGRCFLAAAALIAAASFFLRRADGRSVFTAEEILLAIVFLVTPITLWVVAKAVGGGYVYRYLMVAVIGFSIVCTQLLAMWWRYAACLALVAVIAIFAFTEAVPQAKNAFRIAELLRHPECDSDPMFLPFRDPELGKQLNRDLPVVVASHILYLPVNLYSNAIERSRYYYLIDFDASILYTNSDSGDRHIVKLKNAASLQTAEEQKFLADHREFYLYSLPGVDQWLPKDLANRGYRLQELGRRRAAVLFLANAPDPPGR